MIRMEDKSDSSQEAIDLTTFDLDQLIGLFISLLSVKAWQYMGIQLTPGKEEVDKDLVKASTAIDCVSFLFEKIAPNLPQEDAGKLRAIVADLQINYARQAK